MKYDYIVIEVLLFGLVLNEYAQGDIGQVVLVVCAAIASGFMGQKYF